MCAVRGNSVCLHREDRKHEKNYMVGRNRCEEERHIALINQMKNTKKQKQISINSFVAGDVALQDCE